MHGHEPLERSRDSRMRARANIERQPRIEDVPHQRVRFHWSAGADRIVRVEG